MGYRSDVAYTIRFTSEYNAEKMPVDEKPIRDAFFTFLAEAKSKPATELAMKEVHVNEDTLQLNFYCESVKWYDSYQDVESHEELISLAREWVSDCPYIGVIFSRVGEELEDMQLEFDGNYDYEWLHIHRSVVPDWT